MERIQVKENRLLMRINPIQLRNNNQLIKAYRTEKNDIIDFFDYKPFNSFGNRLLDLQKRSFNRKQLSDILHEMNMAWDAPEQSIQQIKRLKAENSVVVIGGQQAGLLTGPMYTVNKIISVLKLAREQEEKLKIPVIPLFWIAGEDHDYDEINHIFTLRDEKVYKHPTKQQEYVKKSISHMELDKEKTLFWLKEAFQDLTETEYTKELFTKVTDCLEQSQTFVDFFARLIYELFPNEGLVLFDSAHPKVRHIQSDFFTEFIQNQQLVAKEIYDVVQVLHQKGFNVPLEVEKDDANLFFHDDMNERILLKRLENIWVGKNDELDLTTDQLLEIAQKYPERLSNNVVTRPIMQEFLFPTLAFVGGDGEISYWAALRKAFHVFDLKMPPVVPRLSFTYIDKRLEKLLVTRVIDVDQAINDGVEEMKMNWLLSQQNPPVRKLFAEVKANMEEVHRPLRQLAKSISSDLSETAEKNFNFIEQNISFLEMKTIRKLNEKYEQQLSQFTEVKNGLKPEGVLQERIWSPLSFINENGIQFIKKLIEVESLSFENSHYVIYLE